MKITSTTLNSVCGPLRILTFRQFLRLVPRRIQDVYAYEPLQITTLYTTPDQFEDGGLNSSSIGTAIKIHYLSSFLKGDIFREFFAMCDVEFVRKCPVLMFFDELAVRQAERMLNCTTLVNFGSRSWFAADPDSFGIIFNKEGHYTLVNYRNKPIMWVMER